MSVAEVQRRAAGGAALVAGRTVVINLLALVGGVVLARLLTPEDFGVVAIGTTVATLGILLADGGIGAALIRGRADPERADLEALLATQLVIGVTVVAIAAAIAVLFGGNARVIPIMALAVPLTALRTPGLVMLERELSYRPLAVVEVTETVAYYAWGIVAVWALDLGVWGLATAPLARALVGSVGTGLAAGQLTLRPRPSWLRTRRLLGFGVRYQLHLGTAFLRDAGLVAATAQLAGTGGAGIWSMARRLLDVPIHLHQALARVSFPAMSRLLAAGGRPGPVLERATGTVGVGTAILTVGMGGAAPAFVPVLLGTQWADASAVVTLGSAALMVSLPVCVPANGFLWAVGEARLMLRVQVISAVVWLGVTLPLLPTLGATAVGLGWLVQSTIEVVIIGRAASRHAGVSLVRPWAGPVVSAAAGGAVALALASNGSRTLSTVVLAAGSGIAVTVVVLAAIGRSQLTAAASDLLKGLRLSRRRPAVEDPDPGPSEPRERS